jgi:LacI family transcriptional regulator
MGRKIALSINLAIPIDRYHDLYKGILDYAEKYTDWTLVWDHYPEFKLRDSGEKPYYDGVLGRIKFAAYDEIKRLGIPCVNIWIGNDIEGIPSVLPDMVEAGRIAAQHLIDRGFRTIINIDNRGDKASKLFYEGVISAISPHKIPRKRYLVRREVEDNAEDWQVFCNNIDEWSREWQTPLGICCSQSHLSFKVSRRLIENNFRIPEDIAIISALNERTYTDSYEPYLSSIDMNFVKVGYESARLLDRQFKGELIEEAKAFIPPLGLIARDSTDTFAIKDSAVKTAMRFIADNIKSNINVPDVVATVLISRRTLERRFNNTIGHTITDEINRLRIIIMKRLLLESEGKLNALYMQTGFSSPKHMRRTFKRYTGMTPGEYRESMKND